MILYIGNQLSKHGVNPTTIETLGPLLEKEGFTLKYASDKKNIYIRFIDMIWTLIKNQSKTELILIDTYSTLNFWYAYVIARLAVWFTIPYAPIIHGGDFNKRATRSPKEVNFILNNAAKVIFPSKFTNSLVGHLTKDSIVIPNSIDFSVYSHKQRKTFKPNLIWVRALGEIYNPYMAIDCLSILSEDFPEASLVMVGGEKDIRIEDLKTYAKERGVNNQTKFTGRLTKEEWHKEASEADFFINTTNVDNMPVSVIEAMALGLTVVSTNVGGIPFLIEGLKTGYLVEKNDANKMSLIIKESINNSEQTMAINENAYQMIKSFDWKVVKEQWKTIILNALNKK